MEIVSLKKALLVAFIVTFIGGCSTTDTENESSVSGGGAGANEGTSTTTVAIDPNDNISSRSISEAEQARLEAQAREAEAMARLEAMGRIVYFEFDKSTLLPEARAILNAHAERLKSTGGRIVLEGHADERGTREYNLALGERRAQSVQSYLAIQGVPRSRLETVSYGEEKPLEYGPGEARWSKNRRVEIRY